MIWEDLRDNIRKQKEPPEARDLRLTRHFVSHAKLTKEENLEFIKKKLRKPISQFDPTDPTQQQFVTLQHQAARKFIEKELDNFLDQSGLAINFPEIE